LAFEPITFCPLKILEVSLAAQKITITFMPLGSSLEKPNTTLNNAINAFAQNIDSKAKFSLQTNFNSYHDFNHLIISII